MKRVIIESPYAGNVWRNKTYLRQAIRDCLMRDEAPFASHGLYPGALDDDDPYERDLGIDAGFVWHECAELVAVYMDLGISPGMQRGIDNAIKIGKPLDYRSLGVDAVRVMALAPGVWEEGGPDE